MFTLLAGAILLDVFAAGLVLVEADLALAFLGANSTNVALVFDSFALAAVDDFASVILLRAGLAATSVCFVVFCVGVVLLTDICVF